MTRRQARKDPSTTNPLCGTDWGRLLNGEFTEQYWHDLMTFVEEERSQHPDLVYPPANEVFRALELTWCRQTKVVIVGQDPYPAPGQAHGLCFSVPCGVKRPYSLTKIHAELLRDVEVPNPGHGSLEPWAHRGVLLLNATLTVRGGTGGRSTTFSHRGYGWERFTHRVVEVLIQESDPVFLLMGDKAQRMAHMTRAPLADSKNVVESPHPAHHTFSGSSPFSRVDRRLRELMRRRMNWGLEL